MSTQNWITQTPLTGGLRIIRGTVAGGVLDANSSFTAHIGSCERVIQVLSVSNKAGVGGVGGYTVEIAECLWQGKSGFAGGPNDLTIVVRYNDYNAGADGPHIMVPQYADLTHEEFEIVVIVH